MHAHLLLANELVISNTAQSEGIPVVNILKLLPLRYIPVMQDGTAVLQERDWWISGCHGCEKQGGKGAGTARAQQQYISIWKKMFERQDCDV